MTHELLTDPAAPPAAPAPASPAPAGALTAAPPSASPGPSAPPDWRATLPEDIKAHKSLEKFKGVDALAKSYLQMETYQGRSVVIPGEDAKPEEVAAFRAKLGVPESPDAYEMTAPAGQTFDPGLTKSAQSMFHTLGLTKAQAQGLMQYYTGTLANPTEMVEALRRETTTQLKGEWGGAFEYNLARADGAAALLDRQSGAGLLPVLKAAGLTNHPAVIKHYHYLGKQFAEDGAMPMDVTGIAGPMEAKQQIDAIRADRSHPFHRGDKAALAEVQRLYEIVAAGG